MFLVIFSGGIDKVHLRTCHVDTSKDAYRFAVEVRYNLYLQACYTVS